MATLPIKVLGSAEELPRRIVTTEEVAALCGMAAEDAVARSGIQTRHWLSDDEDPLIQGARAGVSAVANAGLALDDIDLVLNASGTMMQGIPDGGALLAAEMGLKNYFAFSVHATCLSFLVAFEQAAFLLYTGRADHILIITTESGSRGLNFNQPESALLIGDAAVAFVVTHGKETGQGLVDSAFLTDPVGIRDAELRGFGSRLHPSRVVEHPEDFLFDMNGPGLLRNALVRMPELLERLRPGLSKGLPGVDFVVPHQTSRAGMKIYSKFWDEDRIAVTLPDLGNTIAASIPITLHRTTVQPGETVLLFGAGSGTHYGGLIVEW